MMKVTNNLVFAGLLLLVSCSSEQIYDEPSNPDTPDTPGSGARREVLLTLDNRLSVHSSPRAIATAEENTVSTLDVYVFGSETENGTYTFQERFCYRDDNSGPLPANAEELQLSSVGSGSDAVTTGLLSLKRGLFVKLYCIANDTVPVNPLTGNPVASKELKPITFRTEQQEGGSPIAAEGWPGEKEFVTFHTPLLTGKADGKNEVLRTPLAMSGALTTPLDLTEAGSASRLQARFRLTRLAARFDIVNRSDESRFIIRSVSMGNGRRGSTFFPIAVTGGTPATDGELITYAARDFAGIGFENADANKGLSQGAFYSYPSPKDDEGFLILEGLYRVNETETKEVSYRIPFRQKNADGTETLLEINNNHRYTIGITRADDYHLDFTLSVADWNDEGSVDDYEPDNQPGDITITIPDAFKDESEDFYDEVRKTHTVTMSLLKGSTFTARTTATSPLHVTKTYAGGGVAQKRDWLQISEPSISKIGGSEYTYTFSLTTPYNSRFYPRCTVRMFDALSGAESIMYVEALSVPQLIEEKQPSKAPNGKSDNPNTYAPETATASMYRITGSRVKVNILCPGGLEEVTEKPEWLDVIPDTSPDGTGYSYTLQLNDRDVADATGRIVFKSKKRDLTTELIVTLLDAPVEPSFDAVGPDNSYIPADDASPDIVTMTVKPDNECTIPVTSMDGVSVRMDFDGGPEWLGHNAEQAAPATLKSVTPKATSPVSATPRATMQKQENIVFTPVKDKLADAKPVTVTLVNTIQGPDYTFIVKPEMELGTLEKAVSVPAADVIEGKKLTLYKLPEKASYMTVAVTSYGGSVLESSDATVLKVEQTAKPATAKAARATSSAEQTANVAYYKLTALKAGTATLTHSNHTDKEKTETYSVEVIASDITTTVTDHLVTLKAQDGQSATAALHSTKGFTAAITDYGRTDGGVQWLSLQQTDFDGGNVQLVVLANSQLSNVHPATVTLTNKITDGGNLTLTVTPEAIAPVLIAVAGTASPTQNAQTDAVTLKLYRVSGSKISFKASAAGGTKIVSPTGVTVTDPQAAITPADGTNLTDYTYTVTLADAAASGSFTVANKLYPEKTTAITVTAPQTVTAAPAYTGLNLSLSSTGSGNTATNTANFPEGFTASVTDWGSGDNGWFTIGSDFGSGSQNIVCTSLDGTQASGKTMQTATVTLANKITGGDNKTFTVTPVFETPTGKAAGTSVPSFNENLSGGWIKLYEMSGADSYVQLSVSAGGGTYLKSSSPGLNVVAQAGTTDKSTTRIYTVNRGSYTGTDGYVVFVNTQDNSKEYRVNVRTSQPLIVTQKLTTVTAATSGSSTVATVTSGGCSVSVTSWGGGDSGWFTYPSTLAGGENVNFNITQVSGNTSKTMKVATVKFTMGTLTETINITPASFSAPGLSSTSGSNTDYYINTTNKMTTTVYLRAGGTGTPTTSNSSVATASVSGGTLTVTPKGLGTCTITVPNKSDTSKKVTYSVSVSGKTYDNGPVYKDPSTSWYIAPKDAGSGRQSDGKDACSGKGGASWALPSRDDWNTLNGSFSFLTGTAGLSVGSDYWSSSGNGFNGSYASFGSSGVSVGNGFLNSAKQWRCISR